MQQMSSMEQAKEDEMGRACNAHGSRKGIRFWWERQKEKGH
jgi:hypothetical protein